MSLGRTRIIGKDLPKSCGRTWWHGIRITGSCLLMSLSRMIILFVPLAWGLSLWLGLNGIYAAMALANVLVGFGALTFMARGMERLQHQAA